MNNKLHNRRTDVRTDGKVNEQQIKTEEQTCEQMGRSMNNKLHNRTTDVRIDAKVNEQ